MRVTRDGMFRTKQRVMSWLVVLAVFALPAAAGASGSVYLANFDSANVSQYDADPLTGALSPDVPGTVAAGFRPTDVAVTPNGRSAYIPSLNGTMAQYNVDPLTGVLSPCRPTSATRPIQVTPARAPSSLRSAPRSTRQGASV